MKARSGVKKMGVWTHENLACVILAGGKSTRMGYDKQTIKIDGDILIKQLIQAVHQTFDEVLIISNTPEIYLNWELPQNVRIEKDEVQGEGPVMGLYTAFLKTSCDHVYLMACDMPTYDLEYINGLWKTHLKEKTDVTVSRAYDYAQPFHGIYKVDSTALLKFIETSPGRGLNSYRRTRSNTIYQIKHTVAEKLFIDINTPRDLKNYMGA